MSNVILKFSLLFACSILSIATFPLRLEAAGPVTNTYLANRFLKRCPHYSAPAKRAFLSGVLFPDIHHVLKENEKKFLKEAPENPSLEQVLATRSAFDAGVLFFHFINAERERYHEQSGLYTLMKEANIPSPQLTLDFWEDEKLIYREDGKDYKAETDKILAEEKASGISVDSIKKWHKMMSYSSFFAPSKFLGIVTRIKQSFGPHTSKDLKVVCDNLGRMKKDNRYSTYVTSMVQHFDDLFELYTRSLEPIQ